MLNSPQRILVVSASVCLAVMLTLSCGGCQGSVDGIDGGKPLKQRGGQGAFSQIVDATSTPAPAPTYQYDYHPTVTITGTGATPANIELPAPPRVEFPSLGQQAATTSHTESHGAVAQPENPAAPGSVTPTGTVVSPSYQPPKMSAPSPALNSVISASRWLGWICIIIGGLSLILKYTSFVWPEEAAIVSYLPVIPTLTSAALIGVGLAVWYLPYFIEQFKWEILVAIVALGAYEIWDHWPDLSGSATASTSSPAASTPATPITAAKVA